MIVFKQQHPSVYTSVPLSSGLCRYLEVYISKEHDHNDVANNGLIFLNDKFRVFPCAVLEDSAKIVSLKLNPLPLLPKNKVLTGLQEPCSVWCYHGLGNQYRICNWFFFMGSGYAMQSIQQSEYMFEDQKFQDLNHQII